MSNDFQWLVYQIRMLCVSFWYCLKILNHVDIGYWLVKFVFDYNMNPVVNFIHTLKPRQNVRHFADDIFKCIFLNENIWMLISVKFVARGPINNIPAFVQIMVWHRPGDKSLSEPMMVGLLTNICVNVFSITIKIHWQFHFAANPFLAIILPHATTA